MKSTIGIDLGGTIIKIGLVTDGKLIDTVRLPADSGAGLGVHLAPMAEIINGLMQKHGLASIDGVGLAFPGIVDFKAGKAAGTNAKYSDAPQIDLSAWVRENWPGGMFVIDNDARMAAMGEWKAGAGAGRDNLVMMTIGTGIGTGTVIDGNLIYGKNYCAGALGGHIAVDYKGRRCTCGNIGCVEALASSFFLPEIIMDNTGISADFRNDIENRNFRTLFGKYAEGDRDAGLIVEGCMDVWSAAVVNYIHAYDPEVVILGGGIMKSSGIILPYIKEKVGQLAWRPEGAGEINIVPAVLGDDAAVIGAHYYFEK